jgi:Telomere resolvase
MIPLWLKERWPGLLEDMDEYDTEAGGEEAETQIQAICEAELSVWRAYCQREGAPLLAEVMIEARTWLRFNSPCPGNDWWDEEVGTWQHIGLKYLNCTEEEWEQLRIHTLAQRLPLHHPEELIARACETLTTGLMKDHAWPAMVGALALLTGRTLVQILKHGDYARKTAFSLRFQDTVNYNSFFPGPFEVSTLAPVDLVLQAWNHVRAVRDWSLKDERELFLDYAQAVYEDTDAAFGELVPLREEEQDLFEVLRRSVYPCLATYYYCPPSVEEAIYRATVMCRPLALLPLSPGERFAEAAVMKQAFEYVVADAEGHIDERKSLWLDREGVKIVEALARPEDVGRYMEQAVVEVVWDEEELQRLDAVRQHMGYGLAAREQRLQAEEKTARQDVIPNGSLQVSLRFRPQGVSPRLCAFIIDGMSYVRESIVELLLSILEEEARCGLELQRPFTRMETSELRTCPHGQAVYELTRRTILSLIRYNRSVLAPEKRWYIDEDLLFQMVQQDRHSITDCLQDYQQEIDEHHREFDLTVACNEKPIAVTKVIELAEQPSMFCDDDIY